MQTVLTISGATPAAEGKAVVGVAQTGMDRFDHLAGIIKIVGGTGGVSGIIIQSSFDDGVTWYDLARTVDVAAAATKYFKFAVALDNKLTEVGIGTAVALAKGTVAAGSWGSQIRVLAEAGAGMSVAGSARVDLVGTFEKYR